MAKSPRPDVHADPSDAPPSEERVGDSLQALLEREVELDLEKMRVVLKGGTALLDGEVRDRETRRRVEEIAAGFGGVDRVDNRLRVEANEPKDVQPIPRKTNAEGEGS
jgi:osmotically-inducible protein OsmY